MPLRLEVCGAERIRAIEANWVKRRTYIEKLIFAEDSFMNVTKAELFSMFEIEGFSDLCRIKFELVRNLESDPMDTASGKDIAKI